MTDDRRNRLRLRLSRSVLVRTSSDGYFDLWLSSTDGTGWILMAGYREHHVAEEESNALIDFLVDREIRDLDRYEKKGEEK